MFQRTFTYNKLREKIHTSNLTKKKKETWKGLWLQVSFLEKLWNNDKEWKSLRITHQIDLDWFWLDNC